VIPPTPTPTPAPSLNLDQSNPSGDGAGNFPDWWQSFTAGVSGKLTKVGIQKLTDGTATLRIYQGEGTGGSLLFTGSMSGISFDAFVFTDVSGVSVTRGQKYTIQASLSGDLTLRFDSGNPYPGGRLHLNPGYDLVFQTFVLPALTLSPTPIPTQTVTIELVSFSAFSDLQSCGSDDAYFEGTYTIVGPAQKATTYNVSTGSVSYDQNRSFPNKINILGNFKLNEGDAVSANGFGFEDLVNGRTLTDFHRVFTYPVKPQTLTLSNFDSFAKGCRIDVEIKVTVS
jgi:hypothetical protein